MAKWGNKINSFVLCKSYSVYGQYIWNNTFYTFWHIISKYAWDDQAIKRTRTAVFTRMDNISFTQLAILYLHQSALQSVRQSWLLHSLYSTHLSPAGEEAVVVFLICHFWRPPYWNLMMGRRNQTSEGGARIPYANAVNPLCKIEKNSIYLCFRRMVEKTYRNNNPIPHNPLFFDSGLSGMGSKKITGTRILTSCTLSDWRPSSLRLRIRPCGNNFILIWNE